MSAAPATVPPIAPNDERWIHAATPDRCYAAVMKRLTIVVPDELNTLVEQERRRRDVSAAHVVRDALQAYLVHSEQQKRLPFIGLGRSGHHDTARSVDSILAREWGDAGDRR